MNDEAEQLPGTLLAANEGLRPPPVPATCSTEEHDMACMHYCMMLFGRGNTVLCG